MAWLLDTNVISELRRRNCHPEVRAWVAAQAESSMKISVMSLGELRRGIELKRIHDPAQADVLERWLMVMIQEYSAGILLITEAIADRWGRMCPQQPLSGVDGLIAATAFEHGLTVVTRNTADFRRAGVSLFNPFVGPGHD